MIYDHIWIWSWEFRVGVRIELVLEIGVGVWSHLLFWSFTLNYKFVLENRIGVDWRSFENYNEMVLSGSLMFWFEDWYFLWRWNYNKAWKKLLLVELHTPYWALSSIHQNINPNSIIKDQLKLQCPPPNWKQHQILISKCNEKHYNFLQ